MKEARLVRSVTALAVVAVLVAGCDWGDLDGVPAGFADGVDNETTYAPGDGLTETSGTLDVEFAGTGAGTTVARSDHYHYTLATSIGGALDAVVVDAAGNVGIGDPSPAQRLSVSGNVVATGNLSAANLYAAGGVSAVDVTATGTLNASNAVVPGSVTTMTVVASGNVSAVNVTATGDVSATDVIATGNVDAVDVAATGNVSAGGTISATNLPAVKQSYDATLEILDVNPAATIATITVNFPADGYAVILSEACIARIDAMQVTATLYKGAVALNATSWDPGADAVHGPVQTLNWTDSVTAGSATYSLTLFAGAGNDCIVRDRKIIVMYFPVALP